MKNKYCVAPFLLCKPVCTPATQDPLDLPVDLTLTLTLTIRRGGSVVVELWALTGRGISADFQDLILHFYNSGMRTV